MFDLSGTSLLLFFVNLKEISEQASRQVATEEPKKVCKHAKRRNLRYFNLSRDENPQRENEMDNQSFEGFQTQLTLV